MLSSAFTDDVTAVGQKAIYAAQDVYNVVSWPEEDLAAVIGVDAMLLASMLIALKAVGIGLYATLKKKR